MLMMNSQIVCLTIFMCLITFVFAILNFMQFGRGLKEKRKSYPAIFFVKEQKVLYMQWKSQQSYAPTKVCVLNSRSAQPCTKRFYFLRLF